MATAKQSQSERNISASIPNLLRISLERWLPAGLIGAVAIGYLAYIHAFGVNVPFWDDWTLGQYFFAFIEGRTGLDDLLIAKNNEHLVGVPFALMILFHWLTGYDAKSILYLSATFQFVTLALLLALAWPMLPRSRWRVWHALILALLVLSLAPTQNILWGFQLAWNLITLLLVVSLWFLARAVRTEPRSGSSAVVMAAVAATLASFSSAQGLAVWLAGAVFLMMAIDGGLQDIARDARFRTWCALAIVCAVLYGWVFSLTPTPHQASAQAYKSIIAAPLEVGRFLVGIMSTAWGGRLGSFVTVAGASVAVVTGGALLAAIIARSRSQLGLPLALLAFGLSCAVLVALGRLPLGESAALQSRYSTYALTALAGCCLLLLRVTAGPPLRLAASTTYGLVALGVVAAYLLSARSALETGREWRLEKGIGALILLNGEQEPRFKIERMLCWNADIVWQQAVKMRATQRGVFREGPAAIPAQAAIYSAPPPDYRRTLEQWPNERPALERLWDDYVTRPDVRAAIPVGSPTFAADLIRWAAAFSRAGGSSAAELAVFAPAYQRLQLQFDALSSRKP